VTRQTTSLPDVSILATKSDLAELRIATKSDIAELRAELRAEVATAKLQAITVLISAMAVFTAVGTLLSKVIH
jgi:hypothetical protein